MGKSGPAPHVVFEIASDETWKIDLEEKPVRYAHMGVQEYSSFDPFEPLLPESGNRRLFGWQLDVSRRSMRAMRPRSDGSLWSPSLESWLVPDGALLRLYDNAGQLRLTRAEDAERRAEAAHQRAEDAIQRAQAIAEKLRSLGIDPDQILRES